MRQSVILAAGFAAMAAASPAPQNIDFASVNAAPMPTLLGPPADVTSQSVNINPAASGSAAVTGVATASATAVQNEKRWFWWNWGSDKGSDKASSTTTSAWGYPTTTSTAKQPPPTSAPITTSIVPTTTVAPPTTTPYVNLPCATQPDGFGPKVQPDTDDAFANYAQFAQEANSAKTPSGYTQTFKNLNASIEGPTYLGLTTYTSYDVAKCAAQCDATTSCTGINIYVERDPSVNPSDECPNPASITNYKCTLWGSSVAASMATNYGQYRNQFHVIIAGSNAYQKNVAPPTQPGWQPPQQCGGGSKGHSHPQTCLGQHFFPGPYNPSFCSAFAVKQNEENAKQIPAWLQIMYSWANYNPYKCKFFNSYMLKKNGKPQGTFCALFTQGYSSSQATYSPGQQGGDAWEIESSWTYSLN